MFERRSELLGLICRLQDLALTALAFPVAYWVRIRILMRLVSQRLVRPDIYPLHEYWALFMGILVIGLSAATFFAFTAMLSFATGKSSPTILPSWSR